MSTPAKYLYEVRDDRAGDDQDLPLLSVSITRGVVPRAELTDKEGRADDLAAYKRCSPGDIVINRMSVYQGALGISRHHGLVSPDYLVLRPRPHVDGRFLSHVFKSTWFVGAMTARLRGIGSVDQGNVRTPRINVEDLGRIEIQMPPPDEQRVIADYLDRQTAQVDALIAAREHQVDLLEERFAARRDRLLSNLSGPVVRLGRFVVSIGQGTSPQAEDRTVEPGEWGVLKLSAVKAGAFIPSEHKALPVNVEPSPSLVPRRGDLLVTRANTPRLVGDACAVQAPAERLMLCDLIYVLRLSSELDPQFAAEALLSRSARHQLSSAARGTSQSMVKLRGEDVKAVEILVPSIESQRGVVRALDSARSQHRQLTDSLRRSVDLLRERRQALITAAVTGQITTPVTV